jgi:hypothetical protein
MDETPMERVSIENAQVGGTKTVADFGKGWRGQNKRCQKPFLPVRKHWRLDLVDQF